MSYFHVLCSRNMVHKDGDEYKNIYLEGVYHLIYFSILLIVLGFTGKMIP